jgi:hypothetical protein
MKSIKDNSELYTTVRLIAGLLREAGDAESARALDCALSVSSLPGEVLGEVRAELQRASVAPALSKEEPRRMIEEALAYLDCVLGPGLG